MKTIKLFFAIGIILTNPFGNTSVGGLLAQEPSPHEIIRKADEKMQGKSNSSVMSMTVVRPTWQRTFVFKNWFKGTESGLTLITDPAKEKGQTFLKVENEMWSWNPKISRMIKLPPSMLAQGWMGSDMTNDDLLKESSITNDFDKKILGVETIDGYECYKVELIPKPEAAVVWGKIVKWISKEEYMQLRSEYYDEDFYLIKTETASKIKKMDGRLIPTHFELIPEEDPGNKTIVEIRDIKFDIKIDEKFFSQQNMKRVR